MKLWFASDHHFGHTNIIKFANRPFSSVEEMNETMIKNHNAVVQDDDHVWFLGDVAFNRDVFHAVMPRLKGKKRLILGNHDKLSMKDYMKYFEKIQGAYNYKTTVASYTFTHYPAFPIAFHPSGEFVNVYGHTHRACVQGDPRYINICVEHTDYTPVDLDWLDLQVRN